MKNSHFIQKYNLYCEEIQNSESKENLEDFQMATFDLLMDYAIYHTTSESCLVQKLINARYNKVNMYINYKSDRTHCENCDSILSMHQYDSELVCENCGLIYFTTSKYYEPVFSKVHHSYFRLISKYNRSNRFQYCLKRYGPLSENTKQELITLFRLHYDALLFIYGRFNRVHFNYFFLITKLLKKIDPNHPEINPKHDNISNKRLIIHQQLWDLMHLL